MSVPVGSLPVVGFVPDQAPEAVQEVESLDDHVSSDESPLEILVGLALKLIVGSGKTVTVRFRVVVPPGPVHASE